MRTMFIIIMALLLGGSHFFVIYRLWNMIPVVILRIIVAFTVVLALSAFFAAFLLRDALPLPVGAILYRIGTSWLMIFLYLLIVFIALDLLRLVPFIPVKRILTANMTSFYALVIAFVLIFGYGYFNYRHKHRTLISMEVSKPADFDTLKILAISDLHLGDGISKKEFESWLPLFKAEGDPDIVLIAGDVVDSNVRPLLEHNFAESIRKINAKYGVFAVVGNHEYIGGLSESEKFLRSSQITLLRDSVAMVNDAFYIIGRDDRSNSKRKPLSELTKGLDMTKPVILLDHQPSNLEEAAINGIDLQFSGHTHGGQIWPISLVTKKLFEKSYGYVKKGNTHVYVSSGLGIWGGKFRIGTKSEYVVINLSFPRKLNSHPQ